MMTHSQPLKTYRLTWDELMARCSEIAHNIAPGAVLEVNVYAPETAAQADPENQALIALLQAWREEDATDNPQELGHRDVETETLMANLQANRLSLREPHAQ